MKHLIIYAHPNPASFNHAVKNRLMDMAVAEGHEVVIRDLYQLGFDPVLKPADFIAIRSGNTPEDIKTEQAYVTWADMITIVHPIWWTGMPAILKGYVDRVLAYGFAYAYGPNGLEQKMSGKELYIVNTVGAEEQHYTNKGIFHAMKVTAENTFGFCGFNIVHHRFFAAVPFVTDEIRRDYLETLDGLYAIQPCRQ